MHIAFVCTGNICRSPFGERYAKHVSDSLGLDNEFSSFGVGALIDHPMEELMAERLEQRGGSSDNFAARQLSFDTIDGVDLFLPLESSHRRILIEEYPQLHKKAFVLRTAARTAAEAPDGVDPLQHILNARPHRRPGDSIADPYRRGPAAADKAAEEISKAVDRLFSRYSPA